LQAQRIGGLRAAHIHRHPATFAALRASFRSVAWGVFGAANI
jgi:hypothetical protein